MRYKAWKIIRDSYKDYECAAYVGGEPAPWFKPERGVHQGAPLSMPLYQVYINELLQQLRASSYAATLFNQRIGAPAFADDISCAALHKMGLNSMLQMADKYSTKWKFDFGIDKCVAMIWGKDNSPEEPIMLGNGQLNIVNRYKHMGIQLSSCETNTNSIYSERIGAGRGALFAARGLGSLRVPVPPKVMSKLYWSVAIPRMTYGLEVVPMDTKGLADMEHAHRQHAKIIQGLPMNSPKPAPLATVGWLTIGAYVAILKLCFLWRILSLPVENIYRRITVERLQQCFLESRANKLSPIADIFSYVSKYGLREKLLQYVFMNTEVNLQESKRYIKKVVWDLETLSWKATQYLYPELSMYYNKVPEIQMHAWWRINLKPYGLINKISCVLSLLIGGQPPGLQRNFNSSRCGLCQNSMEKEDPCHVLFSCPALEGQRNRTWQRVLQSMPPAMVRQQLGVSNREKTEFLLSCLNNTVTTEWHEIYMNIIVFIHDIYKERARLYDAIM